MISNTIWNILRPATGWKSRSGLWPWLPCLLALLRNQPSNCSTKKISGLITTKPPWLNLIHPFSAGSVKATTPTCAIMINLHLILILFLRLIVIKIKVYFLLQTLSPPYTDGKTPKPPESLLKQSSPNGERVGYTQSPHPQNASGITQLGWPNVLSSWALVQTWLMLGPVEPRDW